MITEPYAHCIIHISLRDLTMHTTVENWTKKWYHDYCLKNLWLSLMHPLTKKSKRVSRCIMPFQQMIVMGTKKSRVVGINAAGEITSSSWDNVEAGFSIMQLGATNCGPFILCNAVYPLSSRCMYSHRGSEN